MPGIDGLGLHIPRRRLSRQAVSQIWGGHGGKGERAVAAWDEDTLTMAVEAATACLEGTPLQKVDALLFSSTTFPYKEKQSAALLAEALDLRPGILTVDIASTLRGLVQSLQLASDMITSGRCAHVLVVAADTRPAPANGRREQQFGDGAVALLVGVEGKLLSLKPLHSHYNGVVDVWRMDHDPFVQGGDDRFVQRVLYEDSMVKALKEALEQEQLPVEQLTALVLSAEEAKLGAAVAKGAGIPTGILAGGRVYDSVGHAGAAALGLNLADALEQAAPGDRILIGAWGDGVDVLLGRAGPGVMQWRESAPLTRALSARLPIAYGTYLRVKGLVAEESISPFTSEISLWRDHKYLVRLHAPRCNACSAVQYPPRRVCFSCGSKDNFAEVALSKEGSLFTFTVEHLFPVADSALVTAAVDLIGGGRIYTQLSDCDPAVIQIGMPLKLCFRRLHDGGGFRHYFWKARPVI